MHITTRSGMTLPEVLIVSSIITMIAVMVIPSMDMARRKTNRAICINNLRVLESAADTYCMDKKLSGVIQIDQDILLESEYIYKKLACPEGDIEYGAFSIDSGPSCPVIGVFPDHRIGI